jgi:hypothetical protein
MAPGHLCSAVPPFPQSKLAAGGSSAEEERSLRVLEAAEIRDARSLKNAVAQCLLEDGGARALIKSMTDHLTEGALVTSCLRALFYIGDTQELVTTMVGVAVV